MSMEAAAEHVEEQTIAVSGDFGFVIRRRALEERNIPLLRIVIDVFEGDQPIAATDELLSFAPKKGSASAYEFSERLLQLGLEFFDDFFEIVLSVPRWCEFRARYASSDLPGER